MAQVNAKFGESVSLKNTGVTFDVTSNHGGKVGKFKVNKSGIKFTPAGARRAKSFSWESMAAKLVQ